MRPITGEECNVLTPTPSHKLHKLHKLQLQMRPVAGETRRIWRVSPLEARFIQIPVIQIPGNARERLT